MPSPLPVGQHVAAFHVSEDFIVAHIATFISDGLRANERVVVVATLAHWNAVTKRLQSAGVEYGRAAADGRLILVEADQVLDTLTVDGHVDVGAFRTLLEPLLKPGKRVRIYGEVVSLLVQKGDIDGAVAVEALGHELTSSLGLHVLCGYRVNGPRPRAADIARIEAAHDRSIFERRTPTEWASSSDSQCHAVRFYESAESLARMVSDFLGVGLEVGLPAVVIATPDHRRAIAASLQARGVDVHQLTATDNLIFVDAEDLLATFMVEGMPDPGLFRAAVTPVIERACRERKDCVVRAYGEMVDVLWKGGQTVAAVKLETMWNQLAHTHAFALLCGYSMGHFYKDASVRELQMLHTHASSDDVEIRNGAHP